MPPEIARKLTRCYMSPEDKVYRLGVNREAVGYRLLFWEYGETAPAGSVWLSDTEAALLSEALVGKYEQYESNRG